MRNIVDAPEIYDISPVLSNRTAVFPGDEPFSRDVSRDFKNSDNILLSSVRTTLHLGAHTDAPNHYDPNGLGIAERPLGFYLGPCQVVSVRLKPGARIRPKDLGDTRVAASRVLFHTGSYPDPDRWNGDFNSLSAELIDKLASQGVVLVGIDTPSIDPAEDKVLESHQAVARHDLAILEGIVLARVPDGFYTLAALPLRLEGADASPVRAVLINDGKHK